jgi:hypothetical protein
MWEKFHQYHVTITGFVITSIAILGFCSRLEAKDLSSVFARGYNFRIVGFGGLVTDLREPAREFAPVLSSAVAQAVTQQFPLTSIAPAFTYRYNPALSVFERTTGVPGPLFSERALTLGQGRFNFNIGYSYIDFDDSNGTNLRHIRSPGLIFNTTRSFSIPATVIPPGIQLAPGEELNQAIFFASEIRTRIGLQAHVIVPSLRYGVTENFDISVNIPVVNTFVRVRNETRSLRSKRRNPDTKFRVSRSTDGSGRPTFTTTLPKTQLSF